MINLSTVILKNPNDKVKVGTPSRHEGSPSHVPPTLLWPLR